MRVALHGPLYSGKTSLSRQLVNAHGFTLVNYTDYLKELAVRALGSLGIQVTVEEIKANKGFHRTFLQGLGTEVGFDEGGFVEQCLWEQASIGNDYLMDDIVFDNVRTAAQYCILNEYGFTLVRLAIPYSLQVQRAAEQGVSATVMTAVSSHQIEQPIPHQPGEITMVNNGDYRIEDIATHLVEILSERQAAALTEEIVGRVS